MGESIDQCVGCGTGLRQDLGKQCVQNAPWMARHARWVARQPCYRIGNNDDDALAPFQLSYWRGEKGLGNGSRK